jgi:hypothetical protein
MLPTEINATFSTSESGWSLQPRCIVQVPAWPSGEVRGVSRNSCAQRLFVASLLWCCYSAGPVVSRFTFLKPLSKCMPTADVMETPGPSMLYLFQRKEKKKWPSQSRYMPWLGLANNQPSPPVCQLAPCRKHAQKKSVALHESTNWRQNINSWAVYWCLGIQYIRP